MQCAACFRTIDEVYLVLKLLFAACIVKSVDVDYISYFISYINYLKYVLANCKDNLVMGQLDP